MKPIDYIKQERDQALKECERLKAEVDQIKHAMLATEYLVEGDVYEPNLVHRAKQLINERAKLRAELAKAQAALAVIKFPRLKASSAHSIAVHLANGEANGGIPSDSLYNWFRQLECELLALADAQDSPPTALADLLAPTIWLLDWIAEAEMACKPPKERVAQELARLRDLTKFKA